VENLVLAAEVGEAAVSKITAALVALEDLAIAANVGSREVLVTTAASVTGSSGELVAAALSEGSLDDLVLVDDGSVALGLLARAAGLLVEVVLLGAAALVGGEGLVEVELTVAAKGGDGVVGLVAAALGEAEAEAGVKRISTADLVDTVVGGGTAAESLGGASSDGADASAASLEGAVEGSALSFAEKAALSTACDDGVSAALGGG